MILFDVLDRRGSLSGAPALHQVVAFFHGAAPGVFALLGLPLPLLQAQPVGPGVVLSVLKL